MTLNKKNRILLLTGIFVLIAIVGLSFLAKNIFDAATQSITYYVSPTGSDSNPGTSTAPFASIDKARDTIRAAGQTGVTVYLRGGEYDLTAPVTFTSADSGTATSPNIYMNYPGEKPVFKASKAVPTTANDSGLKSYTLSKTSFPNIDSTHVPQLFLNGTRIDAARYPNATAPVFTETDPYSAYYAQVSANQPDCSNSAVKTASTIYYDPSKFNASNWDLANYSVQVQIWTAPAGASNYDALMRPVASIDQSTGKIMLGTITNGVYSASKANYPVCSGNVFFIQGVPNLIDKAGEYAYNNTTRQLTVNLPHALASTDKLTVPAFYGAAFKINGANYLQFKGFEISEVDGDGLFITQSKNIVTDGLLVHGVIGNGRGNEQGAPTPSGIEGDAIGAYISDSITIKNSTIYDTVVNRGISLLSSDTRIKALTKSNDQVLNNEIYNVSWRGGIWTDEYSVTIQHNYIHDLSNTAISGNLTLDDISYNRIESVDSNVCDAGAIYTHGAGSFVQARNNKIHDNYIQSSGGYCYKNGSYVSKDSTWAIYLDNTASYNQMYNNILVDVVGCGIQNSGWGNSWKNNICITNQGDNGYGLTLNGDMTNYYASAYTIVQNLAANGYNLTAYQSAFPDLKTMPATWDPANYQRNLDVENNIIVGRLNEGVGFSSGRSAIYFRGINYSGSTVVKNNIYFDPKVATVAFKGGGFYPFTPTGCVLPYGTPPTYCADDHKVWDIAGWQSHSFDTNGGKEAVVNPLFIQTSLPTDPAHPFSSNFSLQSGSPAIALGFVNIDKTQIGLRAVSAAAVPSSKKKSFFR